MSKAVLVMDMPEKCGDCVFSNPDGDYCPFHGYISMEEYLIKKPDDCPLKPMPEKITVGEMGTMDNPKGYDCGYLDGWNACIDEICGKEHEDELCI